MEPEYEPTYLPGPDRRSYEDLQRPGPAYFEASWRPSCDRLTDTLNQSGPNGRPADATHGDSSETNPRRAGHDQEQEHPDMDNMDAPPGTFLDRLNRYQRVVANEPPHADTDSHKPKETRWRRPYPDEGHQHNLGCRCIPGQKCSNGHHGCYTPRRQRTPSETQREENPTDGLNFHEAAPIAWLTDYIMADVSDLKTMAKPWYCIHEALTQGHDTTTVEAMYHFFCFALLHPGKSISEFRLDEGRYLVEAHKLAFNDVKGDVYCEARKRTKAFGLFLDNNPQFLFRYRAGMRLLRNLAQKAVEEQSRSHSYTL